MMRVVGWTVAGVFLMIAMVTQIFDPYGARLAFSFEPTFHVARYPFQYGSDSCKTELSTVGSLTLVIDKREGATITHDEFLLAYTNPPETPLAFSSVMGVVKSVVSDPNGTRGHAWIKTPDGVCRGNVYAVDVYHGAIKIF
jgi:hypothetical protein